MRGEFSKQHLPKGARKAFEGVVFDVYQWDQVMFDGSTRIFEKIARSDIATVIPVTSEGKIVIVKDEQPAHPVGLSLPGGGVDSGETPLVAAARELLEEAGYKAERLDLMESYHPSSKVAFMVHYFIGRNAKKVAEPKADAGERTTPMELSFGEFIELAENSAFRNKELAFEILKMRLHPERLEAFRKSLGITE